MKPGNEYYFESKKAVFLTGGSYDHCIQYFDVYNEIYFKYGPSVFKINSRTYLFNRSKSIYEALKECEDDFIGPYGQRKFNNITCDDPFFMEYNLDYKCVVINFKNTLKTCKTFIINTRIFFINSKKRRNLYKNNILFNK